MYTIKQKQKDDLKQVHKNERKNELAPKKLEIAKLKEQRRKASDGMKNDKTYFATKSSKINDLSRKFHKIWINIDTVECGVIL